MNYEQIIKQIKQDLEEEIEAAAECVRSMDILQTRTYLKGLLQARALFLCHLGSEDAEDDQQVLGWNSLADSLKAAGEKAKSIRKLNEALKELGVLAK